MRSWIFGNISCGSEFSGVDEPLQFDIHVTVSVNLFEILLYSFQATRSPEEEETSQSGITWRGIIHIYM